MFFFKTIYDVNEYVENLKKEYNPLRIRKCQTVANYNETTKKEEYRIPLEVEYFKIQFACKHFGKHRKRSNDIRKNQKVLASGCNYHVEFKYNRLHKGFIISSENKVHNHEIGPEIYRHYAENRKIPTEVKEQVIEMLNVGAKPSLVRKLIEEKTSKVILTKDLHNLKKSIKPKPDVEELAELGEQETNPKVSRKRWRTIKANYTNYLKADTTKSEDKPTRPYIFHREMSFLQPVLAEKQSSDDMPEEFPDTSDAVASIIEIEESPTSPQQTATLTPRKRKMDIVKHPVIVNIPQSDEQPAESNHVNIVHSYDPDEMFLLSQLPLIRALSPVQKMDFQIKFIQLLQSYSQ